MASTFEKKFKTTETTKAAGAEVVSDPIELSPRSKDHVITVTADSSCTANVNVELEMSPDGNNWCPAVSRTVSSSGPSQTGDVIGNEFATDLNASGTSTDYKNNHARGRLNFDTNGNAVATGTGSRDFMDQFIAANKSFNYSQWFKTSEAPTTTYKPVLFRHGGYDDFENAKTVELTDSVTQNLSEPVSTSMSNNYYIAETTANNTNFTTYFSDIQLTSNKKWCLSFWMKSSIFAVSGSGSYGNRIFGNFSGSGSAGFQIRKKNSTTDVWQLFFNGNGGTYLVADYTIPSQHNANNTWVHVLINYSYDSVANNGAISDSIFLASLDLYINGTVCSKVDNTGYSSTTHATTLVSHGINQGTWSNSPNIVEAYDELAYWDGTSLTTSEIAKVYNSGTPEDLQNTTGLTAPDHWWRHEDSSNLNYDTIAGANSGSIAGATQTAITSSDSIAPVNTGVLANIFKTTSNLSISGWFKTAEDATGVLFSNTGGAAATGMKMEVNANDMTLSLLNASQSISVSSDVNEGINWHHIVMTKPSGTSPTFKVYIDGSEVTSTQATNISDDDLKGDNGFTLLSDGQNNAHATSPSSTDSSKLNATLSNWSIHSEVLSANAVKQLYSNGHVRNIKNLPSVTVGTPGTAPAIEAWWQLADTTNPQNDLVGSNHLQYQDGASQTLLSQQVNADGATLVEDSINGNAMTLSLTKSFNFTTNKWVSTADQDTALCLSFNGFEEQAEYFALWKCAQTLPSGAVNIVDGNWHNVILSYRGINDFAGDEVTAGTDVVKFGPGGSSQTYNWAVSFDGYPLTTIADGGSGIGADYIGGLNTIEAGNVGFVIQNRHLKYQPSNTEEEYKPHAQFSAGVNESLTANSKYSFQAHVDETSFHSDLWWVNDANTVVTSTMNSEKPATIYGATAALTNRGAGTEYPVGVPYPLLNPEKLNTSGQASDIEGSNQYINPNRYDASTNPKGGLEGWWRWGDTPQDCSVTINDVKDAQDGLNDRDITAFSLTAGTGGDVISLTSADSIYLQSSTASSGGGTTITFPQVVVEGIQSTICNIKNINSPLLQFVRVKWTGAGSCDLGEDKGEAKICFTNRRKRR